MNIRISEMTSGVSRIIVNITGARTWLHESPAVRRVMEILAVIALSGLAMSVYLPFIRIATFSQFSLIVLVFWRFGVRYQPANPVPRPVVILSAMFYLTCLLSGLISDNRSYSFYEFKAFQYFIIGGLIYSAPIDIKKKRIVYFVFLFSASIDGLYAIVQYVALKNWQHTIFQIDFLRLVGDRPHGYDLLSTYFAAKLAFAAAPVLFIILVHWNELRKKRMILFILIAIALLTLGGILISGSRGTWIALILACTLVLFLYDRKKALLFVASICVTFIIILSSSDYFHSRVIPITTDSGSGESLPDTSYDIRFKLWKASVQLFKEAPWIGVGSGDFQNNVNRLIRLNRIDEIQNTIHAHNIFFQTIATQGIIGLMILLLFCGALLRWGIAIMRKEDGLRGHIIILCTLLLIFEGMTDYYFGIVNYFTAGYFALGLSGSFLEENT